jgi:hypothetical protein
MESLLGVFFFFISEYLASIIEAFVVVSSALFSSLILWGCLETK